MSNKEKVKLHTFKTLVLFFVGVCLYVTIETFFRGYSYRLMGIMGGFAILLCNCINDKISWDIPLCWQMFIGGMGITCLELVSGEFAIHVLGIRMWDYSNQWMPMCDNLICPLFSFFWVLLAGVGILSSDAINYYVFHDSMRPYYRCINGNIWFQMPERICGGWQ